MSKLTELRETRNRLVNEATAIMQAETVTTEQRDKATRILADVDSTEADIAVNERLEKYAAEQRSAARPPRPEFSSVNERQDAERRSFSNYVRYGRIEQRDLGVGPVAGTITGGSQFVPQVFYPVLTQAQKSVGQIISAVNVKTTDSGSPMKIALANDTGNGLTVVGEAMPMGNEVDPFLSSKMSSTDKVTTGKIKVSLEELEDSSFDIEQFVRESLFGRWLRGASQMIVTGSANVESVVTTATSAGNAAATNTLTYGDLLKVWAALDPAYLDDASWLINSNTRASIMGIVDNIGRPIFQPSLNVGAPDLILGRPILIAQQLSSMGAGTTPLLFGDMKAGYTVRKTQDLQIIRYNELFLPYGMIGFEGWSRIGGFATDAGTHPILSLQMKASS